MKIKAYTNKTFEKFINYISRGRKFEDRWSDLELDDMVADIDIPSDAEISDAVRELDLVDDIAAKTGAGDVKFGSDGKIRLLDLDDNPKSRRRISNGDDTDTRFAELDIDDRTRKRGRRRSTQNTDEPEKDRELDFDDKGADVKNKKSNLGAIGALDYDDDVDISGISASIDDVYASLCSDDPRVVKSTIKRYASDITDKNKIAEAMLAQATKLNYECLRALCGDMKVALTAKEKALNFIDRKEINDALARFKDVAKTLTGEGNTYGLIPNAIVACTPDKQIACTNIISFLRIWCDLPLLPLYFRGSVIRHNYDVAKYILDEIETLPTDILTGGRGLLTRLKQLDDVPKSLITSIANAVDWNKLSFMLLGDFIISLLKSGGGNKALVKKLLGNVTVSKANNVRNYIEDEDAAASKMLEKIK